MNILISGIGGPTPRSIAKTVRLKYKSVKIIGIDSNHKALGFFIPNLVDISVVVPSANDPAYWEIIINLIKKYQIDLAFIQPESEVIAWGEYFKKFKEYPCKVLLPPIEYSENLVDKSKMSVLLHDTSFIPETTIIEVDKTDLSLIGETIGYPCWIRASVGSGGLGSLKVTSENDLKSWLLIHSEVEDYTVSTFLPGRHLANQMLYIDGKCVRNAGLECAEYVMADIAPSKVTGNTSFGKFINETELLSFCEDCMDEISKKIGVKPHGVFSFDLKEDKAGSLKLTEINVRHMAYTGVMASVGFDLVSDTIDYLTTGHVNASHVHHSFEKDLCFLRDVDIEPIIVDLNEIESNE